MDPLTRCSWDDLEQKKRTFFCVRLMVGSILFPAVFRFGVGMDAKQLVQDAQKQIDDFFGADY